MRKQFLVPPEGDSRNPKGEGLELRHSGMSSDRLCCDLLVLPLRRAGGGLKAMVQHRIQKEKK